MKLEFTNNSSNLYIFGPHRTGHWANTVASLPDGV